MPALALNIPYYAKPEREGNWYPNAGKNKHGFRREKKRDPGPLPREEAELKNFAAISEYLTTYKAIERSRYIEQLRDNWNDEGAAGYTRLTWRRTAWFVAVQAKAARDASVSIGAPTIAPADHGSIDIHWQTSDRNLLINVPADAQRPATYYGASRGGETTSGLLDTQTARLDLLLWLSSGR
jgi:hypothetical protein